MLQRIRHRGPDDHGEVHLPAAWMGHARLSIVDVEGGHQPLGGEGERWLVCNGEIYNHSELREQLRKDRPYHTHSDNEVALRLIEERGADELGRLEGMYALLSSRTDGSGFLAARDPVGIKPLYWTPPGTSTDGAVRFASELCAFDVACRSAVEAFPPGFVWTDNSSGLRRFAHAVADVLPPSVDEVAAEPDADTLKQVQSALIGAVHRQMMGDVPIGVFLSGGLDSTLVAVIAARWYAERGERLQTFAVGLDGSSDLLAARQAAEFLGTVHHERVYTAEEARAAVAPVVRAIEHFDPSLVRSAVPNYLLAQMAAKHVKVVLTGEGADELFAGYSYYHSDIEPQQLQAELVRTLSSLHGLNLQRADRTTMAFSLEARVPFLDRAVIKLAMQLPSKWKEARNDVPEKRLLRRAFEGWLPHELLWRPKVQFGDGSGASSVLTAELAADITDAEFTNEAKATDPPLRSKEELAYYRIWREHLDGIVPEKTITRFATT
jgi:asparagine synthase (glutamine-hydrolysing)